MNNKSRKKKTKKNNNQSNQAVVPRARHYESKSSVVQGLGGAAMKYFSRKDKNGEVCSSSMENAMFTAKHGKRPDGPVTVPGAAIVRNQLTPGFQDAPWGGVRRGIVEDIRANFDVVTSAGNGNGFIVFCPSISYTSGPSSVNTIYSSASNYAGTHVDVGVGVSSGAIYPAGLRQLGQYDPYFIAGATLTVKVVGEAVNLRKGKIIVTELTSSDYFQKTPDQLLAHPKSKVYQGSVLSEGQEVTWEYTPNPYWYVGAVATPMTVTDSGPGSVCFFFTGFPTDAEITVEVKQCRAAFGDDLPAAEAFHVSTQDIECLSTCRMNGNWDNSSYMANKGKEVKKFYRAGNESTIHNMPALSGMVKVAEGLLPYVGSILTKFL